MPTGSLSPARSSPLLLSQSQISKAQKRVEGFAMVNATKGLFISCDIPMTQFIINYNNSLPPSQKFIIHILDNTKLFVQPHASEMIRNTIQEFRLQNSYEKPT